MALKNRSKTTITTRTSKITTTSQAKNAKISNDNVRPRLQQRRHNCSVGVFMVQRFLAITLIFVATIHSQIIVVHGTNLGSKCQHDMDCTDFIKGSTCSANGYCECAPYFVQYDDSTCLSSQLLGGDCQLDEQCTMKVSNSSCSDGACRCVEGFLQFRKHTCLGPALPGAVCYSHAHCQMNDERTHCDFLIPNLFGRCQCTAPTKLYGGLCMNPEATTPVTIAQSEIATTVNEESTPAKIEEISEQSITIAEDPIYDAKLDTETTQNIQDNNNELAAITSSTIQDENLSHETTVQQMLTPADATTEHVEQLSIVSPAIESVTEDYPYKIDEEYVEEQQQHTEEQTTAKPEIETDNDSLNKITEHNHEQQHEEEHINEPLEHEVTEQTEQHLTPVEDNDLAEDTMKFDYDTTQDEYETVKETAEQASQHALEQTSDPASEPPSEQHEPDQEEQANTEHHINEIDVKPHEINVEEHEHAEEQVLQMTHTEDNTQIVTQQTPLESALTNGDEIKVEPVNVQTNEKITFEVHENLNKNESEVNVEQVIPEQEQIEHHAKPQETHVLEESVTELATHVISDESEKADNQEEEEEVQEEEQLAQTEELPNETETSIIADINDGNKIKDKNIEQPVLSEPVMAEIKLPSEETQQQVIITNNEQVDDEAKPDEIALVELTPTFIEQEHNVHNEEVHKFEADTSDHDKENENYLGTENEANSLNNQIQNEVVSTVDRAELKPEDVIETEIETEANPVHNKDEASEQLALPATSDKNLIEQAYENEIEGAAPINVENSHELIGTIKADNQANINEKLNEEPEQTNHQIYDEEHEYTASNVEQDQQYQESELTPNQSDEKIASYTVQQPETSTESIQAAEENQESDSTHHPASVELEQGFKESESVADILSDLMVAADTVDATTIVPISAVTNSIEVHDIPIADMLAEDTNISEEHFVTQESPIAELADITEVLVDTMNPNDAINQQLEGSASTETNEYSSGDESEHTLSPEELPFDLSALDNVIPQALESENLVTEETNALFSPNLAQQVERVTMKTDIEETSTNPTDHIEITTQTMQGLASRVTLMEPATSIVTTPRPLMASPEATEEATASELVTPEPINLILTVNEYQESASSIPNNKQSTEIRKRVDLGLEAVSLGLSCINDKQCQLADPHTVCNQRGVCDCAVSAMNIRIQAASNCNAAHTGCSAGTFQCRSSGVCISWFFVCDGRDDCNDASDEECTFNARLNQTCPAEAFLCGQSGRCISRAALCDGHRQCPHGEDELGCTGILKTTDGVTYCPPHTFRCNSGECLPEYEYCNAIVSCRDGSDELPHLCGERTIPTFFQRLLKAGGFMVSGSSNDATGYCPHRCSNGRCRSTAIVCSGRDGCGDGTDEQTCSVCRCPAPIGLDLKTYFLRQRPMPLW